jgi:amidase
MTMSSIAEYDSMDGLGMAELVHTRQVHPGELLEAALERAARWNPHVNALSTSFPDRARGEIVEGLPAGPFEGVPFLLKSLSAMLSGAPATLGSRLFADYVADHDSTLVERYKQAGLVIFGMTTTPEMGLSVSTETSYSGTTRNPWNLAHSPGGSSGGSAAAVAAGIVPLAHGSDGGGSIRIPASACGLFGLKPTRGRTPSGPMAGEGWGSLATSHVISRSVRDSAAALDATHGAAPGDPYCAPPVAGSYLSAVGEFPKHLKVALQLTPMSGVAVAPECHSAVLETAKLLEDLGHDVEESQPEGSFEELQRASWVLVASNVRLTLSRRAQALGRGLVAADVDRITWAAVEEAGSMSARSLCRCGADDPSPRPANGRIPPPLRRAAVPDARDAAGEARHPSHGWPRSRGLARRHADLLTLHQLVQHERPARHVRAARLERGRPADRRHVRRRVRRGRPRCSVSPASLKPRDPGCTGVLLCHQVPERQIRNRAAPRRAIAIPINAAGGARCRLSSFVG